MPKDNDRPDEKKLGKDLVPGDIIRAKKGSNDTCIIVGINNHKDFYNDEDHYEVYDINYCSDGPYLGRFNLNEEFNVVCNRRDILKYYDLVELELLRKAADLVDCRKELINIKKGVIIKLNKELKDVIK